MSCVTPLPIDAERRLYYDGIDLFNSHKFFEAHEQWEVIWCSATGLNREFYQGMIQCAVALEHYRRGNPRGVMSLYKSYRRHFQDVPNTYLGLDVRDFLDRMHGVLSPVIQANPVPERGAIALDVALAPKINLLYHPDAAGAAAG